MDKTFWAFRMCTVYAYHPSKRVVKYPLKLRLFKVYENHQ